MRRVKHLQQRLEDLRERERLAKLHNRELLLQFEEAQNTLREVLDHTAAMKMLRKKYMCNIGSCSHWDHQLNHQTQTAKERMFGERQQNHLKTNHQLFHSHGLGKMFSKTGTYQDLSFVPELQAQTLTPKFSKKLSHHSPSSFPHDPFRPHLFPSRPAQEHPFTHYYGPSNGYLSHTISPNELHTEQLIPWPPQTETMPKQPPSCSSQTSEEDCSHSEDLDEKPVRLSTDQEGSKASSRAASQGSTQRGKSNQSNSSDEDRVISNKSSPSREPSMGSKAMELISESEDTKTFSNQIKHRNGIGFKDTKNKDDSSEDRTQSDMSDVENSSVNLSKLAQEEPQGSARLKKIPTIKEKEQSLSYQSSLEDEDDSEKEMDGNGIEISQEDGEMSNQEIPVCSPGEESDHKTLISGSTSSSFDSKESASSEGDGGKNNMKVCEPKQDTALGPEDSDSEDCIVSPQTRSKIINVTTEHVVKHRDEESNSKSTLSVDEDSNSSSAKEDIEHVLAPPAQTEKQRNPKDYKSKEPSEPESDDFYD